MELSVFFLRRFAHSVTLVAVLALTTFVLIGEAPGSYLDDLATNPQVSQESLARMRAQFGLDRPFYEKFWRWARSVASGDFGYSFVYQRPIRQLIGERIVNTVMLNVLALIVAWSAGILVGLLAAASRGSWIDWIVGGVTTVLLATPGVVLALVLLASGATLGLPIGGLSSAGLESPAVSAWLVDLARHLVLPVIAVAAGWFPAIARHTRAALLVALEAPYMLTARAKGVGRGRLLAVHALREALNPLTSLFGPSVAALLSASLLVEVVMGWPGIGQLTYDAVLRRDIFLVVDLVMLSAVLLLVGNIIGDLLLRRVDPRVAER